MKRAFYHCLPAVLVALSAAPIGCGNPDSAVKGKETQTKPASAATGQTDVETQLLQSAVDILLGNPDPQVYTTSLRQLNQYIERKRDAVAALDEPAKERVAQLFGPETIDIAGRASFENDDAEFLKGVLFLHSVARRLRPKEDDELAYGQRLFEWVVRYTQINPSGSASSPPMVVCLRGTANAEERAWIFAELLRQAGLHACAVGIPNPAQPESISLWLSGQIVGNEVYLYEPAIGLPVRAGGKHVTLAELVKSPDVLNAFSFPPDLAYAVKPPDIKGLSLLLILEPEMFAPRMKFLEDHLTGDARAQLISNFESLIAAAQSAIERIPDNQGVRVWREPRNVRQRFNTERLQVLATLNMTWLIDPESARMLQLQGRHIEAIERFTQMFLAGTPRQELNSMFAVRGLPARVRQESVMRMPQDVLYFTGLSKLEQEKPSPAEAQEWFSRYVKQFGNAALRPDEVLNWGGLIKKLHEGTGAEANAELDRLRQSLPEPVKAEVGKLNTEHTKMIQRLTESGEAGKNAEFDATRFLPTIASQTLMIDALNAAINQAGVLVGERDAKGLSKEELVRRNRVALGRLFSDEIGQSFDVWHEGVARHTAIALKLEGKLAEATALLEQDRPFLPREQRMELRSLARSWRDQPIGRRPGPADANSPPTAKNP